MKQGYIFTEEIKDEMLELRKQGYSYSALARKYGVDHSTIMYHCKQAGITLGIEEQKTMFQMIQDGIAEEQIALHVGVSIQVVQFYHSRYGSAGTKNFFKTPEFLEPLDICLKTIRKEKEACLVKQKPTKYKIDKRGVEWRLSKWGEWICLGRSEEEMKLEIVNKKKREVERKRLEMLIY